MADVRLIQRLEEQLRDAHATNAELRERIGELERERNRAKVEKLTALERAATVEKLAPRLKQAENLAHAAHRKHEDAESGATKLRGQNEELRGHHRLDRRLSVGAGASSFSSIARRRVP
jgi:hypothetical protein